MVYAAKPMNAVTNPDAEFAYGSGQIDPIKAANPGLVYDMGEADYVSFLCGQGYTTNNLRLLTGDNNSNCSSCNNKASVLDLNYPSFALSGERSTVVTGVFHRTLTNVGSPSVSYKAVIKTPDPDLLDIHVEPDVLFFESLGQKLSFIVKVRAKMDKVIVSGSLI